MLEVIHLLLIVAVVMAALVMVKFFIIANQHGARWNHVLIRSEELRTEWQDSAPKDIWEVKRFHKADTTKEDLFSSYNALMEGTGIAVRLANQTKIFLPREEREQIEKLVVTLNEAAVDANASANYTQLEADGVERVNTLRVALNALRTRAIQDLEAMLYTDTERRMAGLVTRPLKQKTSSEPEKK